MTNSRNQAGYLIKCGGCCGFSLCDQYGAENKNLCWGDNTLQIESGDNKIRLETPRNGEDRTDQWVKEAIIINSWD